MRLASANLHFGEEPHFVGRGGSGTIFFSCCNLGCIFCQNHDISHGRAGIDTDSGRLAGIMLELARQGAENINLVTPSHYPADILEAVGTAVGEGLNLPVVYNTSAYDALESLTAFDSVVDVYMPDLKFGTDETSAQLSAVRDYTTVAGAALKEMVRQVGGKLVTRDGVAVAGVSLRHLVMPGFAEDSIRCLELAASVSTEITVNVMSQYRPAYRAHQEPRLAAGLDRDDYRRVVEHAHRLGFRQVLDQA